MLEIPLLLIIILLLGQIGYLTQQLNNYRKWESDISKSTDKLEEELKYLSNKERNLGRKYRELCEKYNSINNGL